MTEPRRLRTQAERDTDGTTWRTGGGVEGNPVHVELHPDECVLVVREGVGVMCVRDHQQHDPALGLSERQSRGLDALRQPRRRWWHRYTRRA